MRSKPTYDELRKRITEQEGEIRDLKRIQEELYQSEERYRSLVEEINEVVYCLDVNAVVTYVSPNIERLCGYHATEIIGKIFTDFVHKDDLDGRIEQFRKILSGVNEASEYRMIIKSGECRWVRTAARPIIKDGRVVGLQGVLMDLTERIRAEERRKELEAQLANARKMEALGIMAGGIAHDLNNILGGIVGYPDLLLSQIDKDSRLRKPLQAIQKSGEKAAAIVQDLLSLARRNVGTYDVVNLNNVIRDHLLSPEHEQLKLYHPGVTFIVNLEESLSNIKGVEVHLSKTIMNLLYNAAEAMPEGGTVTISTANRSITEPIHDDYDDIKPGDYVVLSVSDEGTGLSAEDMERIFEPFYTKKVMGRSGTGLGMAVVWGAVKDHLGYIDIDVQQGCGVRFNLYFPATHETARKTPKEIPIDKYIGKGETILVVDDVAEQREVTSHMLRALGYTVITLSSGEEVVEYLKHNKADLVVLDMIMDPGIDGLETYRRILEYHPHQKAVIVSGFSETDRIKEAQKLGAGEYIMKPYRMEKIGLTVRAELNRK
jgi:PAS domain S-box-containing protein